MKLYNSLTRKKEKIVTHEENKVKIYTCGPTVYDYAHIGNLRSYIFEDVLEKSFSYLGYEVIRVMNITDVGHLSGDFDGGDDKMLQAAIKENKGILEIAKFYTEEFKKDFEKLNLKWPSIVVPATSCIDVYIKMISSLLEKGYAYKSNGNVYLDTSKLENYYVFGNHEKEDLMFAVRDDVFIDEGKKNKNDFALWFTKSKFENQALKWDSPFGEGYPGWHIECSGICYKYLGEYLDIHCGGVDNKFPHHTNEIAQSESFLGHKWCSYWVHVAHLNLKDGKMSKSSGKFLRVKDLEEKGYNPLAYKLFVLASHYRKELTFSFDALDGAKNTYNKLIEKISALNDNEPLEEEKIKKYQEEFISHLSNDLNTASLLTTLYDVLKSDLNDSSKLYLVRDFDKVLSLNLIQEKKTISKEKEEYILSKIEERQKAKEKKDYATSDKIRDELLSEGIILMDTKEGTTYKIKE